jgi:GT2 family glycosyltransferase
MISIVICSINDARFDAVCEQYRIALGSEPYEIIRIPDAKSMCDGYNRGLMISRGEMVIFSHDDIEIWAPDFAARLKSHLQTFDVIGVAGTNRLVQPGWIAAGPPHIFGQVAHRLANGKIALVVYGAPARIVPNIQAMDGLFLAFRREAIMQLRWDQQTFTHFHCYDIDCTYRAHRAGMRVGVALDLPILHMSGGSYDATWEQQAHLFLQKHHMTFIPTPQFIRVHAEYADKATALPAMQSVYARMP